MCGIIGYVGKNNALKALINGLKALEYRGYDSVGVAYFLNDKIKMKTLYEGDNGREVEKLQELLLDVVTLYPSLPIVTIDGIFNSATKNAVKEFQELNGLTPSGIVDDMTWNKLQYLSNKNLNRVDALVNGVDFLDQSENIISEGSTGDFVKELQEYLNIAADKYPSIGKLKVDGIFGPKTKAAVIEFQKLNDLTPDGIVGTNTWEVLSK